MAEFTPPCASEDVACVWGSENRINSPEQCLELKDKIVEAGGATALEMSGGCPQMATRRLMHAAVDGDVEATDIELRLGFDAEPFTEALRRVGKLD